MYSLTSRSKPCAPSRWRSQSFQHRIRLIIEAHINLHCAAQRPERTRYRAVLVASVVVVLQTFCYSAELLVGVLVPDVVGALVPDVVDVCCAGVDEEPL